MPADWASIFCALKAGMFADSSETVSDRLPATRMKGRTRTISRLPLARVVVETRITSRAAFASPGGGSRSALRVMLATRSAMLVAVARSVASTRSGTVAKLVSPSSAAKTAPPIRAAPQSPVRMVPLNHCTEMRRRSRARRFPRRPTAAARRRARCARPPGSSERQCVACRGPKSEVPSARGRFTTTAKCETRPQRPRGEPRATASRSLTVVDGRA